MIKVLKNKDGNMAIQAVVVMLVLLLLFSVISEYLRLQIIAKGYRGIFEPEAKCFEETAGNFEKEAKLAVT